MAYIDAATDCRVTGDIHSDVTSYVRATYATSVRRLQKQSDTAFGAIVVANWEQFCAEYGLSTEHPDVLDARELLSGTIEWPIRIDEPIP